MTHTKLETIPATWSDEHDGAFFRVVRDVFRPAFVSGATALLMSYDEEDPGSGAGHRTGSGASQAGSPAVAGAGPSVRYSTAQSPVIPPPSAENRN